MYFVQLETHYILKQSTEMTKASSLSLATTPSIKFQFEKRLYTVRRQETWYVYAFIHKVQ